MKKAISLISAFVMLSAILSGCVSPPSNQTTTTIKAEQSFSINDIPEFTGEPYVVINDNIPNFTKSDITSVSYEYYGEFDEYNRCTSCIASIGSDLMPTEKRGDIGMIKPTGWHTVKYDCVDGKYLYNRCHLIGYQLTAENANPQNLITGTRYLNTEGMLPFENEVAEYVKETDNHVLYRVTPIFKDAELVARGVQMEAYSVEDNGKGVEFNVYCYNNQPNVEIDYQTGKSKFFSQGNSNKGLKKTYIVNTNSNIFHKSTCKNAQDIGKNNKKVYTGTRDSLINNGYKPCKICNP